MSTQTSMPPPQDRPPASTATLLPTLSDGFTRSMDAWAERQVTRAKRGIRTGVVRWLWSRPYWYRSGGDAWVDEAWWIDTARQALAEDAGDASALEVLLANEPEHYRDHAEAAVESWQRAGGFNSTAWEGVLGYLYPEHPVARRHFESRYSYTTIGAAARCFRVGYQPARDDLRQAYLDYRRRRELPVLTDARNPLGRELLPQVLAGPELERVRLDCYEACAQRSDWADVFADQSAALRWAVAMGWGEIPEHLSQNRAYPQALLFGPSGSSRLALGKREDGRPASRSPRDAIIHALREHMARAPGAERAAPAEPCRLRWSWGDVDLLLWTLVRPEAFCAQLIAAATSLSKLCRGVDFHYRLLLAIAWTRVREAREAGAGGAGW